MSKLLSEKEALEIMNALATEYGISPIVIKHELDYYKKARPTAYEKREHTSSFLGIKWKSYKYKEISSGDSLEQLVNNFEYKLSYDLSDRVELAEQIRRKHAARVIDNELRKPDDAK